MSTIKPRSPSQPPEGPATSPDPRAPAPQAGSKKEAEAPTPSPGMDEITAQYYTHVAPPAFGRHVKSFALPDNPILPDEE